jgi:hypothetical protein
MAENTVKIGCIAQAIIDAKKRGTFEREVLCYDSVERSRRRKTRATMGSTNARRKTQAQKPR